MCVLYVLGGGGWWGQENRGSSSWDVECSTQWIKGGILWCKWGAPGIHRLGHQSSVAEAWETPGLR